MKKKMITFSVQQVFLPLLLGSFKVFAQTQVGPLIIDDDGDTTWVLNTHVSDEFDHQVLDRRWGQQIGDWKGTHTVKTFMCIFLIQMKKMKGRPA